MASISFRLNDGVNESEFQVVNERFRREATRAVDSECFTRC